MEVLGPNLSREKKKLRTSREILNSVNLEQSDLVSWCAVFIKLYFLFRFQVVWIERLNCLTQTRRLGRESCRSTPGK